jgi:hypothetical protein
MLAIMPMITMTPSISISEKPRWPEVTWYVIRCLQSGWAAWGDRG